ncbi:MAG: alpha-1,2-fucosyltransferase [bacterium]
MANIAGGLGNQLFCYAATKAIAQDLGYDYRYRVCPLPQTSVVNPTCNHEGTYIDRLGQEYNPHFERVFHIDTAERVEEIPEPVSCEWTWHRSTESNFDAGVYDILDNTHLKGHYMHPAYFEHRRSVVLQWLKFNPIYLKKAQETIVRLCFQTGADHLVSMHIRGGLGYRLARQILDPDYHRCAMDLIHATFKQQKLLFILFSDVPRKALRELKGKHRIYHHAGTMFEDLCLMTLCDSHIVANSTFSWWGAWLAKHKNGIVIRPSIWPASDPGKNAPTDMFPDEWVPLSARRERLTFRGSLQRLQDEYSPFRDPCVEYPRWFDRYVRKPLKELRQSI